MNNGKKETAHRKAEAPLPAEPAEQARLKTEGGAQDEGAETASRQISRAPPAL
jgi:hypothetical protein